MGGEPRAQEALPPTTQCVYSFGEYRGVGTPERPSARRWRKGLLSSVVGSTSALKVVTPFQRKISNSQEAKMRAKNKKNVNAFRSKGQLPGIQFVHTGKEIVPEKSVNCYLLHVNEMLIAFCKQYLCKWSHTPHSSTDLQSQVHLSPAPFTSRPEGSWGPHRRIWASLSSPKEGPDPASPLP